MEESMKFYKAVMLGALALAGCDKDAANTGAGPALKDYAIMSDDWKSEKLAMKLEVADTDEQRMIGLMHREKVPSKTGMIFVFDEPSYYSMWMKNTLVPLDMVFLNDDRVVISVALDRKPLTEDYITPCNVEYEKKSAGMEGKDWDIDGFFDGCEAVYLQPKMLTRYVVELPAGDASKAGIKPGDVLVEK
jgi:uncharacterized membrane protein (UPF0127 family)